MAVLNQFTPFLESVNLAAYRRRFLPTKIVEMDMPKAVQAISLLYKIYWDEKRFISFDDFFGEYKTLYRKQLEIFRCKVGLCRKCFTKGLPARIYRTWAGLITQIHAGYVAAQVFGAGSVKMTEELDHQGADFQVTYCDEILNYQVKKESQSREKRAEKKTKNKLPGEAITISYFVPDYKIILSPRKRNGEFKKAYKLFYEEWLKPGKIQVLSNGFVIFTPLIFAEKKEKIDAKMRSNAV